MADALAMGPHTPKRRTSWGGSPVSTRSDRIRILTAMRASVVAIKAAISRSHRGQVV